MRCSGAVWAFPVHHPDWARFQGLGQDSSVFRYHPLARVFRHTARHVKKQPRVLVAPEQTLTCSTRVRPRSICLVRNPAAADLSNTGYPDTCRPRVGNLTLLFSFLLVLCPGEKQLLLWPLCTTSRFWIHTPWASIGWLWDTQVPAQQPYRLVLFATVGAQVHSRLPTM